ncbi:hypothetical protein BGZ59_010059 [Podila verticillata]|nr:hypothetical protein BGZ59_010059 [Podila verticillata]KFH72463.1 hypothetical protein MVEG_02754 [Podila verticillata NRRL 6337]
MADPSDSSGHNPRRSSPGGSMRHRSPQPHERFTPYGGPISPRSPSSPRALSGHYFRSPSSSPSLSNSVLSGSMSTSPSYMPSLSVLRPPSIQTSGSPSSYPHPYSDGPQYQQHLSPQSAAFPPESDFSRSFASELSPTSPSSTRRSFSHSPMPQPYPSWQEVPYSSDWSPPGRDHPHAQPPHALPPQLRMHPPFATSNQYPYHISEPQGVRPTRRRRRPTVSYSNIIITAIRNSPQQRLRLSEIYEYVSREIPQMMGDDKGWQNTVRHNLSHNRCFRRETPIEASAQQSPSGSAEEEDDSSKGAKPKKGKGGYWVLVPEELEDSMSKPKKNPNDRRRRKNTNVTEASSSSLMDIDRDVASMVIADSHTASMFSSSMGINTQTGHVSDDSESEANSVYSRSDNSDSEPEMERDGDYEEQVSPDESATPVRHPGMSLQNMLN